MIADLPPVVINEIAWMGTVSSANDEWVELYNNTDLPVSLDGWTLKNIKLIGKVPAQGFYLLERTDDSTLPQVAADQIYTGALNNKGEQVELFDGQGVLIDSVDALAGWPAGDNSTKQTMERKNSQTWQTSQNTGGTPKAENSQITEKTKDNSPPLVQKNSEAKSQELASAKDAAENINLSQGLTNRTTKHLSFLIALAIAVFSAIMILSLKRRLNYNKEL
jgi:hypothetical protein